MEEDVLSFQNDECEFDDLCGDVTFRKGDADSEVEREAGICLMAMFWHECQRLPQLEDLVCKFPNINWVKNRVPNVKIRSLNHLSDRSSSASNQMDDSSGLKEYLESSDKRDSANQLFRRSLYKRSKLFDARKSSSILSRDAQLRRLAIKKTGNGYKRMEGYIATCLRDIMSENTLDFFESKVGEIEERMRNGYYVIRGLDSIKEDISRMCRDAIKIKNRGDARDMNRIVTLFIRLATSLDKGPKLAYARDVMKSWKDESPPGFSSSSSKYKKSLVKAAERKQSYRGNGLQSRMDILVLEIMLLIEKSEGDYLN
ncbi:UNVERIFIED_CONTAM: Histone-lysine N-methyltransferase ATXR3 [Sesamum latifolium]|uniref:Histone-lysine N-methyltransferase ATXR3 n=1 Tax=Sesamum latifolium TaxID=2727402 RepID=A0AAW2WT51_9LAMI